jgi:hypothetical protein
MKHIVSRSLLGAFLAAVVSSSASAQVELIAGWNFGQFLGAGSPSTDGTSGDPIGFIASNYSGSVRPGIGDSGPERFGGSDPSAFSTGTGVLSFSGWDFVNGTDVKVVELAPDFSSINTALANGLLITSGDPNAASLRFTAGSVTDFTISVNTSAFVDFAPGDYAQPNDFNMTLSGYKASGAGAASIEWLFQGSPIGTSSTSSGTFVAFNLDLPANFYGQTNAVLTGRVTGDIVIDNVQINGVAIPEPASFGTLAALAGLAFAGSRRRRA